MQDRVAEVLVERRSLHANSAPGLILSLALHGLLAALILVPLRLDRTPQKRTVITMRLAGAKSPSAGSRPEKTRPKTAPVTKSAPPTPQVKAATTMVDSATKEGKVDPAQRAEKTLFGKSKAPAGQKEAGAPAAATTTRGTGSSEFAVPGIGAAGVTGLEGGDFPYDAYIERMISLVGTRWFRPQMQGEPLATVYFIVERNGTIRDAKVEKSSGNAAFDRAAFRAIRESSPLPPLPFSYSGSYLGVHLTFH